MKCFRDFSEFLNITTFKVGYIKIILRHETRSNGDTSTIDRCTILGQCLESEKEIQY